MFVGALDGFDRSPAHQPGALFGDPPAVHRGIGLMVLGSQPDPAGQLRCPAEAMHITDLGDEDRSQDRPHPGDRLDGGVARVSAQPATGQVGEQLDLELQRLDHSASRVDPGPECRRQHHPLQQLLSTGTEQISHRNDHPARRQHRVHLALQARPQRHQLGSVPHQLPQLTGGRWSDPHLGQPAHPQQIRQIRRIALIF